MNDTFILWVASQYWYYASMWFETEADINSPEWVGYGSQAHAYRNVLTEITYLDMLDVYCSWSFHYEHGKDSQGFCETMLANKK